MFRTGFRSDNFSAARLGALGLAAVLVLGGCSGSGDDPGAEAAEGSNSAAPSGSASAGGDVTESASASPTPTPTPTPTAAYKPATAEGPAENVPLPVMPELAKQESKEGLEAFAEYWYALANYGYETGDPEPVRAVSAETCITCRSYYRVIQKGYVDDDWMVGGKLHVQDVSSNFVATVDGYFQATTLILQDEMQFFGPEGVQGTETESSTPGVQLMEAQYVSGSGWYVIILETLEM
ncbi:DUF6318 family protein [Arthrobacter sp. zg-Y820]|uniref:DUF6318 family protein n=1 Tax=unclassified Arthrobacter TaxID=235627 RepID=UPI001E59BAAF|nr:MULTISPECIES: DUF6318 family protein [unclassified Arthrobacter]MCC9195481.1 DUF6318 family protein [Arthrobacter sp. zg-Y820]MDK1278340.1 DUF6318 family protein [Arthrobacter sp. zg.Y820]WIB10217.1 DUF6318 family protein [Arthrobacter sp. zg-Y820]